MVKQAVKFIGQVLFLWVVYMIGNETSAFLHLPIPGNVLGMVLLFLLLLGGVVRVDQLSHASDFLLKHITFFFIPIAVGLLNWVDLFYQHMLVLILMILVSAVGAFWTVGYLFQRLQRGNEQ